MIPKSGYRFSEKIMLHEHPGGPTMRAEVQNIVDEIKQSIGLLRRHL